MHSPWFPALKGYACCKSSALRWCQIKAQLLHMAVWGLNYWGELLPPFLLLPAASFAAPAGLQEGREGHVTAVDHKFCYCAQKFLFSRNWKELSWIKKGSKCWTAKTHPCKCTDWKASLVLRFLQYIPLSLTRTTRTLGLPWPFEISSLCTFLCNCLINSNLSLSQIFLVSFEVRAKRVALCLECFPT